ncbi:MAG: response regulator receiver sensor signal transduction histidine kinase [Chitinophagaceae bacterium]|nr:response regulator receiver sensor signal transduction histidine kinase [Chitinophagaceae bacterium]
MILIVDDRPENIFSLKTLLELHGFRIDTAESGEEALKKVLHHSYSLIILDVQMPGMDGFEVADAILGFGKAKDTPIIFLSAANTEKHFITQGYTSGGMDYVTKPVDPDILLFKVKTFYKLSEQRRELIKTQNSLRSEIENRKKTQHELDGRIEELHSVLESLPQIAFTIAPDGQVEYVNERWYNYSEKISVFPQTHPDDVSTYKEWEKHFGEGTEYIKEVRIKELHTGTYRYCLLRIIPVRQHDVIMKWVGTYTDIHQHKLINETLEQKVKERTKELITKNEELEMRNHELQQFAWVASHDLKEPLRKIQTFSYLLRDKHCKDAPEAKSYLDRTIKSSERMTDLINALLDYSRLSVSSLFQKTDLNGVLNEILADLEVTISEKHAIINATKMPVIDGVHSQLRQVFQNLISNSLKFSKQGAFPQITITSELVKEKSFESPLSNEGKYCRIQVCDNGIGFDEKYLDRVFTIFQRLNDRRTYEGTGIGLAIAKKIIEKHNGIITAKSKEGEGASFILVLPLHQTVLEQHYEI